MRLPRIVRTVTFKLALLQAGLFAASAAVLFVVVYLSLVGYARLQLRSTITTEAAVLADERVTDELPEFVRTIELRERDRSRQAFYYLLVAADGSRLAGSLGPPFAREGWHDVPASDAIPRHPDQRPHRTEAFGERLTNGELLVVGHDLRDVDNMVERLIRTFGVAAALTLLLAIVSGLLTSLGALRRVEEMNAITDGIMEGDLGRRVPTRGTGDEFDRLAVNTNAMLDRIQALMDGLRQVTNDIAHDLRTPVAHLRQRLETARAGPRTVEAYEAAVEAASEDVDTILRVFGSLLRIAQVEAGTRRAGFADIDLSETFSAITEAYGPVAEDAEQSLEASIEPHLWVRGDRDLLTQMLANLVENAIRHAGPGARIQVALRRRGDGIGGVVSDTGPGIPALERARVFGRFVRLERSRSGEGHGLGLSLVKAVADLHGIRVELDDNAPGLSVRLLIPAGEVRPARVAGGSPEAGS